MVMRQKAERRAQTTLPPCQSHRYLTSQVLHTLRHYTYTKHTNTLLLYWQASGLQQRCTQSTNRALIAHDAKQHFKADIHAHRNLLVVVPVNVNYMPTVAQICEPSILHVFSHWHYKLVITQPCYPKKRSDPEPGPSH